MTTNSTPSTQDTHALTVTDATFDAEVLGASGLVMVDFWAAWCGPCRMIAPVIDALARDYAGRVTVAKLDTDANPAAMTRYNVRNLPSVLFFKDGALVDRIVGAVPRAVFEERLLTHL